MNKTTSFWTCVDSSDLSIIKHNYFKDSLCLEWSTNLGVKGAKRSVKMWTTNFYESFSKNIFLYMSSRLSKVVCYAPDGLFWLNLYFSFSNVEMVVNGLLCEPQDSELPFKYLECCLFWHFILWSLLWWLAKIWIKGFLYSKSVFTIFWGLYRYHLRFYGRIIEEGILVEKIYRDNQNHIRKESRILY